MTEVELEHMHMDLEEMKGDIALIKHILIEEGELSEQAVTRLEKSRRVPLSEFEKL